MRKLFIALALVAPLLATACNTIAGVGEDVTAIGKVLTNSSDSAKTK